MVNNLFVCNVQVLEFSPKLTIERLVATYRIFDRKLVEMDVGSWYIQCWASRSTRRILHTADR